MKGKQMLRSLFISVLVLLATIKPASCEEEHSTEIAELKSGKLVTAKASWWNPDKDNATKALQAAINSGAKQVIVDNIGYDWVIDPVFLVDNQEIIFEKDVKIIARKGSFKGLNDCLFTAISKKNIKLKGLGNVLLKMHKKDYLDPEQYKQSQWRHTLSFLSCEDVEISNLLLSSSGGDGIYIGVQGINPLKYCKNVTVENVICEDHNRQGISIISVENLFINKSLFKNTKGHPPMAGIDFEPNKPSERLTNCIIKDCEFIDNASTGIDIYPVNLDASSEPLSITLCNCKFSGNPLGIRITAVKDSKSAPVKGMIKLENCLIENAREWPLTIKNQPVNSIEIAIKDCIINALKAESSINNPITFISDYQFSDNAGGTDFKNVTVIDNMNRDVLAYKNWSTGKISKISGNIKLEKNGKFEKINIQDFLNSLQSKTIPRNAGTTAILDPIKLKPMPESLKSSSPTQSKGLALRQETKLLFYADKGQEMAISLLFKPLKKGENLPADVKIKNPSGVVIKELKLSFDKKHLCKFIAEETGIYIAEINPNKNLLILDTQSCDWGISAEKRIHFSKPKTKIYFQIPAGVKDFRIDVYGDVGETATATLLDQNSQIIKKQTQIETPYPFEITRSDSSHSEIWAMEFTDADDDVFVRFYAPLNPIFSNSRDNLLITE